jgi:L-fucose mutarotase
VLINIDPMLTPELLHVVALMGHGDEIAVVDANFPADSVARSTIHGRPIVLAGADAPQAVRAILSLVPLDEFVDAPVRVMAAPPSGATLPPVQEEVQGIVDRAAGRPCPFGPLERFAFYDAARTSHAVVLTSERRLYANFLIKKGVIYPAAR